eukprot:4691758-Pleurochrysis_carterae.AAC.1
MLPPPLRVTVVPAHAHARTRPLLRRNTRRECVYAQAHAPARTLTHPRTHAGALALIRARRRHSAPAPAYHEMSLCVFAYE